MPGTRRTTIASTIFAIVAGASSFGAALFVAPAPAEAELLAAPTAIFAGPGYEYPSVAGAGAGEWLSVDGVAVDGWVPVTYYGISGWVVEGAIEPGTEWVPAPEGYYDTTDEEAESGNGDGSSSSDGTITGGDSASSGDESAAAGTGGPAATSDAPATSDPSQVESSAAGQDGEGTNARGERRRRDGAAVDSGATASAADGESPISEPTGGHDLAAPDGQSTSHEADSEYSEAQILGFIYEAADRYGQDRASMERVARCESGLNPYAVDPAGLYYGLFQFVPETFAGTPYGEYDIFDPWANSMAAAWMWEQGRRNEWVCQ